MDYTEGYMRIKELFDLDFTLARRLFESGEYPWEVLDGLEEFIIRAGKRLPEEDFYKADRYVWIAKDAKVDKSATVIGPTIIDRRAEVRCGAFIRGRVIIGKGCVVGNSSEVKGSVLFDGAQVPHYNYVGDSVLGHLAHLGAGAITSNLKSDGTEVTVRCGDEKIHTGRRKLGAAVGDGVEVGCSAVLMPGCVIGRGSRIYPLVRVRGTVGENVIVKDENTIVGRIL